jgi:voltage-gated potassium channel
MSHADDLQEMVQLQSEKIRIVNEFRAIGLIALAVLCGGALFFHKIEHWSWLNSFYFCTITLTTVGYGDFVPTTDAGKLFYIFYVLAGIGIIATFANTAIKNALVRRQIRTIRKRVG